MQSQESESPGRVGTQGCRVEGGASAKEASASTQGNRRLSSTFKSLGTRGSTGNRVEWWSRRERGNKQL